MSVLSVRKSLLAAVREEMLRDDSVILLGEDIGAMGGPWGTVKGLIDEFGPERVIVAPISESGFTGMAVGAAMRGLRPVTELMYVDVIGDALDAVMNQAAKLRFMAGGQVTIPLVIRCSTGTGSLTAGQHSQSLESLFIHIPGLKVVMPYDAYDAKGLMKSAIRDDDPVIFIEHQLLYSAKCEVPDEEYTIPLGQANIRRQGSDVTILSWSLPLKYCLEAAELLSAEGIEAEIIDLRTLVPVDWDTIAGSVKKTRRVMTVEHGAKRGGVGAELSAQITEEFFSELESPVVRLAADNVVIPYSPVLEDTIYPRTEKICEAVRKMLRPQ